MAQRRLPLPLVAPLVLALLLLLLPHGSLACTSILVGSNATTDGSIYLSRTVDYSDTATAANNLVWNPARTANATFQSSQNGFSWPLPAPGLAYWGIPSTLNEAVGGGPKDSISFEEVGVNSAGVIVSGVETLYSSATAYKADPLNEESGIMEDAVVSVVLPHPEATRAKAAVQLLGGIIEKRGVAGGFGVQFADITGDVWYLETVAGHHWVAQRLPSNAFFATGNQGRFTVVDLSSANRPNTTILASPGLAELAVTAGLWKAADGPLNIFRAFTADGPADKNANQARVQAVFTLLGGPNLTFGASGASAPVFPPPARQLALADVMAGLRYHYDGTPQDPYQSKSLAEDGRASLLDGSAGEPWRPIAVLMTGLAHITRIRPSLPAGLRVLTYLASGTPAWAPWVPMYEGLPPTAFPPALSYVAHNEPDSTSLFWKSRRLSALIFEDFPKQGPKVEAAVKQFDADVEARRPGVEQRYTAALQAGNSTAAEAELITFTRDAVAQAGALLDKLAAEVATELGYTGVPSAAELKGQLEEAAYTWRFGWNEAGSSERK